MGKNQLIVGHRLVFASIGNCFKDVSGFWGLLRVPLLLLLVLTFHISLLRKELLMVGPVFTAHDAFDVCFVVAGILEMEYESPSEEFDFVETYFSVDFLSVDDQQFAVNFDCSLDQLEVAEQ